MKRKRQQQQQYQQEDENEHEYEHALDQEHALEQELKKKKSKLLEEFKEFNSLKKEASYVSYPSCQREVAYEVCNLRWQSDIRQCLLSTTNIHQDLIPIVLMYSHEIDFGTPRTIKQSDFKSSGGPCPLSIWKPISICVHENELVVTDVGWQSCLQVFDISTGRFLRHIGLTETFQKVNAPECIKAYDNKVFACVSDRNNGNKKDYIYILSLLDGRLLQTWNDQDQLDPGRFLYFNNGFRICISTEDAMLYVARNAYDLVSHKHVSMLVQISIKDNQLSVMNQIQNIPNITSMDVEDGSNTLFFVNVTYDSHAESITNQIASVDVKTREVKKTSARSNIKLQSFSSLVIHGTQIIVGSRQSHEVQLNQGRGFPPILQAMLTSYDRDTFASGCMAKDDIAKDDMAEDGLLHPSAYGWMQVSNVSDLALNKKTQELFICDDFSNTITVTR